VVLGGLIMAQKLGDWATWFSIETWKKENLYLNFDQPT
jgi:hypothetical protein